MSLALRLTGGENAHETANFILTVDRFFDCLNVSSFDEGRLKRKPFLQPYRNVEDFRLKVLYIVYVC